MSFSPPLRIAGLGCGQRTRSYLTLASQLPHLYTVMGAADPVPERVAVVRDACGHPPGFRSFATADELLAADKFADVLIVGTQDAYHVEPCVKAMKKGYDILLEKPIAPRIDEVVYLERRARELGRKVLVCHVLRYTPFYRKVKEIVASGVLGEIVSLNASEGVGAWHQAHSYVRGKWAVVEASSPMIISKSCHDMDIIAWMIDRPCSRVSSHGRRSYFRAENTPAGAPPRCTDGCPVGPTCPYNALLYASIDRRWLGMVMDGAATATPAQIIEWLRHSPWGRCVYQCDNTTVDHQVVAMEFAGGPTATFTMTAFDDHRYLDIYGTRAVLHSSPDAPTRAGAQIMIRRHDTRETQHIDVPVPPNTGGHGGGDRGLILALHEELARPAAEQMRTSLAASLQSHLMGFAAEEARVTGQTVDLEQFARASRQRAAQIE